MTLLNLALAASRRATAFGLLTENVLPRMWVGLYVIKEVRYANLVTYISARDQKIR